MAGGNEPDSGVNAMRQLYASGMADAKPASSGANGRGFVDEDDLEDEFQPKKVAAPEVISLSEIYIYHI